MTEPCTMVNVVGTEGAPDHLLENEIILIRGPRRREASERVGTVLGLYFIKALRRKGYCLIPSRRFQLAILAAAAYQRLGQTVSMMNEVHAETALYAQITDVGVRDGGGINGDHLS